MPSPSTERLDPTSDVVFKLLFSSNERLLISLLTAVLKPESPITSAKVKNPEITKGFSDDKGGFLDILVVFDDGTLIDVEMQASSVSAFCERALYYWAAVFSAQLVAGQNHDKLARVVSILFLNYRAFHFRNFHEVFRLRGDGAGALFSPLLEIHTIELPKLALHQQTPASDRPLVRWCRFLSSSDPRELDALAKEDPMIDYAKLRLAELETDPKLREMLLEQRRRDGAHRLILGAERRAARAEGLAEGKAEGLVEGKAEGLAEGKAEGLVEGKAEGLVEGKAEGLAEGKAEGKAQALLTILEARELAVSDAHRERILACVDADELDRMLRRAATAGEVGEVFE